MRTNIVIDDELMERAMKVTGLSTKKALVEAGLQLLIQVKPQTDMRRLRGKPRNIMSGKNYCTTSTIRSRSLSIIS